MTQVDMQEARMWTQQNAKRGPGVTFWELLPPNPSSLAIHASLLFDVLQGCEPSIIDLLHMG